MAWIQRTLSISFPQGVFGGYGRWMLTNADNGNLLLTDDFSSFTTVTAAAVGASFPFHADHDGVRWYLLDDAGSGGFFRSTNGLTGTAWESVDTNFSGGASIGNAGRRGTKIKALESGRLVVAMRTAGAFYGLATSDDGGVTWTQRFESAISFVSGLSSVNPFVESGGKIYVSILNGMFYSADDGDTWTSIPVSDFVNGFTVLPNGDLIVNEDDQAFLRVSSNLGASWTATAIASSGIDFHGATTTGAGYMLRLPTGSTTQLYYNEGAGAGWQTYDMTGLAGTEVFENIDFAVDGDFAAVLVFNGTTATRLFTEVAIALPAPPGIVPIDLPIRLEVQSSPSITLGTRLQIGATGAALALPARLTVLSDAVLGGLNGAGGWPSAPLGRWRSVMMLDGVDVSSQLAGEIVIQHADNEARTMQFSFRPAAVLQPMSIIGRKVQAYFAQLGDSGEAVAAQLMFTGILETPTINMQSGVISCSCHDQMQEVFANTPREWIDGNVGGRWREEVSGEVADNFDYLEARRLSVPASVALDVQQQPVVIPWRDGLIAETVKNPDMLDNTLSVDLPSRDELRTRITCRLQYRFERLRGRSVVAQYANGLQFYIGAGTIEASKLWLTSAMVKQSVESLRGWTVESLTINNPPPGTYDRGPALEDGVYVISPSVAPDLALGFEARCSTRWQQTVTQEYSVDVVLPDLEAAIGRVSEEIGATFEVPFDVRDWGTDETVLPVLTLPSVGDVVQEWKPTGQQDADRDEVLRTLLDQAWVRLWGASRSGRVRFALPLRPNLWLTSFITIETDRINAAGKVVEIEHRMDPETGEAVTTAAIAVGLPGDIGASLPAWTLPSTPAIDDTRPPETYSFEIGTFVGGDGASVPFDEEAMIGFSTNQEQPDLIATNFYPHQLSIRAPDLEAVDRDPIELEVEAEIATTIPTDLLELL